MMRFTSVQKTIGQFIHNMAISYISSATAESLNQLTQSVSVTVTGTNRILIVQVYDQENNTTGVTFDGVAMTQIGTVQTSGVKRFMTVWYMVNPPVTTANATATRTAVGAGQRFSIGYALYDGVDQSTPFDVAFTTGSGNGSTLTGSITTTTAGCWGIFHTTAFNGPTAASTGSTFRFQIAGGENALLDSNGPIATGGASMLATQSSGDYAWKLLALRPVASGPSTLKSKKGVAIASIKSIKGVAIESVKSAKGLT